MKSNHPKLTIVIHKTATPYLVTIAAVGQHILGDIVASHNLALKSVAVLAVGNRGAGGRKSVSGIWETTGSFVCT